MLRLAAASGSSHAARLVHKHDGGLSSGTISVLVLLLLSLPRRLRTAALAVLFAVLLVLLAVQQQLDTAQHLVAALVTFGLGLSLGPDHRPGPRAACPDAAAPPRDRHGPVPSGADARDRQ